MAKEPRELKWLESLLPEEGFRRKPFFSGLAYYIGEKIVFLIFEKPGNRSYQGKNFSFEVWNGCMFSVEHEHHEKALKRFPFLINHPVLPKWLYLPLETENFDDLVSEVIIQAIKPTSYWGSIPKPKTRKNSVKEKNSGGPLDTRKPRMFSDKPKTRKKKS